MKCITVLLDGASDRSYEQLNNMTPLQYAKLPNLDILSSESQCGLMTVMREGVALGTDLAHLILFGYSVGEYPSRSMIDAIGENIVIDPNALYLRCSFADVHKENGYKISSRFTSQLGDENINIFSKELKMTIDGVLFEFIHSYDSHGFIKMSGENLSSKVSDSDPFRKDEYVMSVEAFETDSSKAVYTAVLINTYIKKSYEVLNNHIINLKRRESNLEVGNILLTKWAGRYKTVESFKSRNGMKGLLLGQSKLLMGLSSYIGMDYLHYETLEEAVELAISCDYDYVHLHTKEPDTASHKKSTEMKVEALEKIDEAIGKLLSFDGLLIVTSDHATPCSGNAIHSGESVAFMAKGEFVRRDDVKEFNEINCSKGSIHLKGKDFMSYVINATDQGAMYHLRQGTKNRHYFPEVNKLK